MISRLLKALLIGFILSFSVTLTAFSATEEEQIEVLKDVSNTCIENQRVCLFKTIKGNELNAYTDGVTIFIYTGILERLSKDELRSILYHELSHILLQHPQRTRELFSRGLPISMWEFKNHKVYNEVEADTLATHLLLSKGYPSNLDEGLLRIVPKEFIGKQTLTHPRTISRVKNIRKIEVMYERKLEKAKKKLARQKAKDGE